MLIKEYLGDSVYAGFDGYGIVLTTENGGEPSNTIFIDPDILRALNLFSCRVYEQVKIEQLKKTL